MKTIFKNENWEPILVLLFFMNIIKRINFIYSFMAPLFNGITLTVQEKYTKCTKVYKATLYERL